LPAGKYHLLDTGWKAGVQRNFLCPTHIPFNDHYAAEC